MGNQQSSYYCAGCHSSYTGGGTNWKRCSTCDKAGVSDCIYCRNCFGDGWNDEEASCNNCKSKYGSMIRMGDTRAAIGGGFIPGDILKIELEREKRADGSVWEKMTIHFREHKAPERLVHQVVEL